MSEDRPHHLDSPSTLNGKEACCCFKSHDSKHERTIAGVIGHTAVETGKDDARLSDRDASAVAACLDLIEQRKGLFTSRGEKFTELREQYLPIDDLQYPDVFGTTAGYVDYTIINEPETYAEMLDWKFGYWNVESAENNLQALSYMLGLFRKFPKLKEVKFFFKLPNVDGFSSCAITRDQIPAVYLRIQVVAGRAREARARGTPDTEAYYQTASPHSPLCSFCAHIGKCPKVAALMINVAHKYYALAVPKDITPTALLNSNDTTMCLRLVQTAKTWADSFKTRVTDRILRGEAPLPEGHHIETRRGDREVVNPELVETIAKRYIPEDRYQKLVPKSVPAFGAMETVISELAPRGSKERTVKDFAEALEAEGAVARGASYSFLKVTNDKERKKADTQRERVENNLAN